MFDELVKISRAKETDPDLLMDLVAKIRPKNPKNIHLAVENFKDLLDVLHKDEFLLNGFRIYIRNLIKGRKFSSLIADLGIVSEGSFFSEVRKRLYNKILPMQPPENSMDFLLSNVFFHRKDYKWMSAIPKEDWNSFMDLMGLKPFHKLATDSFAFNQLTFALELLALRISGTAMDYYLLKMVPEYASLDSPFIGLQNEVTALIQEIKKNESGRSAEGENVKQVYILINQCNKYLERALINKETYGISFSTTIKLVRLQQQLERLTLLMGVIQKSEDEKLSEKKNYDFIIEIIKLNSHKNNVRYFWRRITSLVAYQITQYSGKTGEHYITESKSEYYQMLKSAAGGGFIVGMLCLFKLLYSNAEVSQFGHAFLYSINYAFGFIAIYLLHFTLATKQPAMTAATLAKAMKPGNGDKKNKDKIDYSKFAELFARLFRSQFIAFVGNVFFAFPVAMLMVILWQWMFDVETMVSAAKSKKLLKEINFFESKALLHAGVAGIYLFLSGLISGFFINRNIHDGISIRIKRHPILRSFLPKNILAKLALSYDKHIGGISGNFWLGIFLGSTGAIGYFFGLDIDIRHITFAAGNFGIALMGPDLQIGVWDVIIAILCIGLIGFINFIVSFVLSLTVALRSRNTRLYELYPIAAAIWLRFKAGRKDFFVPPPFKMLELNADSKSNDAEKSKTVD